MLKIEGLIPAVTVLVISLLFGQFIDQLMDSAIKNDAGSLKLPFLMIKIIFGFPNPTDIVEFVLKIFLLIVLIIGG